MRLPHPLFVVAAGIVLGVVLAFMPSCETGQQGPADNPGIVLDVYTETEVMIQSLQREIVLMEIKAQSTPLSPNEAASLARSKAQLAGFDRLLKRARADADAAGRAPDMGDVAKGLTSYLPAPVGIPLGLIIGGVSEFWRTRKKRQSFNRLVNALDTVKGKSPEFAKAMDAAGPAIKVELGTSARAVVDKMRSNGTGA